MECKNFGVTSLNEVREKLTHAGAEAQERMIGSATPARDDDAEGGSAESAVPPYLAPLTGWPGPFGRVSRLTICTATSGPDRVDTDRSGSRPDQRRPASAAAGPARDAHGMVETPAFMPVGTQATVKGLTPDQLRGDRHADAAGEHIPPGAAARRGGRCRARRLHAFMGWDGPILTDSGGFQVFSLAARNRINDDGVAFRSHIDGRLLELTPERAVRDSAGSRAPTWPCAWIIAPRCRRAEERSPRPWIGRSRWAGRCKEAHTRADQALFGIVQGGTHADLAGRVRRGARRARFRWLRRRRRERGRKPRRGSAGPRSHDPPAARGQTTLPDGSRPAPGHPQRRGDRDRSVRLRLADPQWPQRNLFDRQGAGKTPQCRARLDPRPIEEGCECLACRRFSRSYLRHLFWPRRCWGRSWPRFTTSRTCIG